MYKLTPRMRQRLTRDLQSYHALFTGGRCDSWQLEELLVNAINSDTTAQHLARWKENGHDDEADIKIEVDGTLYYIQVKSGTYKNVIYKDADGNRLGKKNVIKISGHRLGRFKGNLGAITDYLRQGKSQSLMVPCTVSEDEGGKSFEYTINYLDPKYLTTLNVEEWFYRNKKPELINEYGVRFAVTPSLSWQVWWDIPTELFEFDPPIMIN